MLPLQVLEGDLKVEFPHPREEVLTRLLVDCGYEVRILDRELRHGVDEPGQIHGALGLHRDRQNGL